MILKKPYAFLIKHFKLLHLILTAITAYLLKSSITVLQFFSSYMATTEVLYFEDYSTQLFNKMMFVLPIIIIVVIGIILLVLVRKKKPTIFYFISAGMAVATYIMFNISMQTIVKMETEIVDAQTTGLIRDFLMFTIIVQVYSLFINFIRGIGFDVKKFDFGKDLQELESTEEDDEEVEISINVDTNKINRKYRRSKRFIRYNYIEHQLFYNIFFVCFGVVFVSVFTYFAFREEETFGMYDTFITDNYIVTLKNAYVTSNNYRGKQISKDKRFVLVEADIATVSEDKVLDPRNVQLIIDGHNLYHIQKYKDDFFDLGFIYMGETLNLNTQTFIFLYEIEDYRDNMEFTFRFAENHTDVKKRLDEEYVDITLSVIDLDNVEVIESDYSKELVIENTIFKDTKLVINSLSVSDKFKINYKKKLTKTETYDSIEYIVPKIDENYDKGLMNVKGTFDLSNKDAGISKFTTFIEKFGCIVYKIGEEEYKFNFKSSVDSDKVTLKDSYYMEIKKEILDSDEIYFELRFRNKVYKYKIK